LGSVHSSPADSQSPSSQQSPATLAPGSKTVKLCDNKTTVQVPNDAPKTRAEGQKIADALMAQWKTTNPNNRWIQEEVEAHQIVPPADNSNLVGTGQSSTYGAVTKQDVQVWKNETYKTAVMAPRCSTAVTNWAARSLSPTICAIHARPTHIPNPTPSSNHSQVVWRFCAT
jgi:hypothetical protein